MMKRWMSVTLATTFLFGAVACGPEPTEENNATTPAANNTTPGNNTTPANNTTPGNNTTPANNTSPTNSTTPANNTSPSGDARADLESFYGLIAEAFCRTAYECPEQDPFFTLAFSRFGSQEACAEGIIGVLGANQIAQILAGIEAGRIEYNSARAQACFSEVESRLSMASACFADDVLDEEPPECAETFKGLGIEGSGCAIDEECAEGFYCEEGETTCHGTCQPDEEGDDCGGMICDEDTQYCDEETTACSDHKAQGSPCYEDDECGSFDSNAYCDWSTPPDEGDEDGTCGTLFSKTQGEDCFFSEECSDGLACDEDSYTCETAAPILFNAMGEDCTLSDSGPFCEGGLVCTGLSISAEGSPEGTCTAPLAMGEACLIDFECTFDAICVGAGEGAMGTCGPRLADGEACDDDLQCQSNQCDFPDDSDTGTCATSMLCVVP